MLENFSAILQVSTLVCKESIVIIDFSTFCNFQVLTFAVQTREGRAIPVFFDIITYPMTEVTSQNIFIERALKKFQSIIGFYPAFVLDRGFALPSLIPVFMENHITFYVRGKTGKQVAIIDAQGKEHLLTIGAVTRYDQPITAYGYQLRLITSENPKNKEEPWYIITNDMNRKRKEIIDIYSSRFEMEEAFKDIKHVFRLKQFFITEKQTVTIVLWFIILGMWLAFLIAEIRMTIQKNAHKKISFIRLWFEGLQRSYYTQIFNMSHKGKFY